MLNFGIRSLWICSFKKFGILLLVLSLSPLFKCQIIRKSIELPVKDYLSSPRLSRGHGDGKDPLYVLGGNIDSVRSFEVLSPHTPASSLMFADLTKQTNGKLSTTYPAPLHVEPVVENRGRSGENQILNLFLPATPPTIDALDSRLSYGKFSSNNLVSSTVTSPRSLHSDVNSRKGYSFSFTTPSVDYTDNHGPQASAQEYIPNYSTPFPSLYQNNDAVFGYFNQFQTHSPTTPDVDGQQLYDYSHYETPVTPKYLASSYEDGFDSLHSIPPLPYNTPPIYNQSKGSDRRYHQDKETHARYKNSGEEESSPEKSDKDENPLPSVPPTIGVIGWKSNTDHDTSWKPNKALMGIANEYIKEDMKNDNKNENSTQYPNKGVEENSGKYESHTNNDHEETSEAENQEDNDEEEEEESEEEDEEESNDEEEEEGYESEEIEDYDDDDDENKSEPPVPPPSYSPPSYSAENSGSSEHNNYENDPYPPIFYDDAPTLPPGPPYYPPPHEQDPRTNFGGYVPPPSFSLGVTPFESIEKDVRQTWTPVTPRTDRGSWPNSGESVLLNNSPEEGGFHFFQWNKFRPSKTPKDVEGNTSTRSRYNSSKEDSRYDDERRDNNGLRIPFRNGYVKKRKVKSKVPLEHSHHRDSRGDRSESFEVMDKEGSGPTTPPLDSEERKRVSDHEFPRKVPTRLHYPGGGLWAKPHPDSGIDLGFVPKKIYTQTRRHNTVKHLPKDAALSQASTQEELINAPRLREVVSHKKTQEVYEEEGYEDSGYDHGGYKKHGESEVDTNNYGFSDDYVPKELQESNADDTITDHVAHLEAIQENDPSGESSSNKPVQNSEKPNVKVSWKQEKTTSNERSMAFLDDKGKGGILTQKHPTKTENVFGKYLNSEKKSIPVIPEPNRAPDIVTAHKRPVSFQRFASFQNANPYSDDYIDLYTKYDSPATKPNIMKLNHYQKNRNRNKNSFSTDTERQIGRDDINSDVGSTQISVPIKKLVEKRMRSSPPSSNSKINNTSLNFHLRRTEPPHKYQSDTKNEPIFPNYNTYTSDRQLDYRGPLKPDVNYQQGIDEISKEMSNYQSDSSRFENIRPSENEKYLEEGISVYSLDTPSSSKERRSRDLTAFGVDGAEFISQSDFTHPTQALRAIEEQLSSISTRRSGGTPTTRPVSKSGEESSGRKYKEIVRDSSQSQEEVTSSRGERVLRVKLKKDDLNSRHPFLPIDGDRDVQIDYVQTRTRVQPDTDVTERRHHYNRDDVDLPPVTEQPIITTTPQRTTVKSSTTTEYTPEDPAQTLGRLRSNVFLSSVFSNQESQEEESYQADKQSTTTPKITTYRAKTTTEEEGLVKETPEGTFERLKSNPFLTAIFLNKNDSAETDERKPLKRRGRTRPIVVLPDDSDIATDSSVKHVEQLTLAHYSGPSNGLLYKQVPTTTQHRISNLAKHLNREGVEPMHIVIRRSVESQSEQPGDIGKTTGVSVDLEKYPFYYSPISVNLPKYSPLRYASNPKDIPIKTNNRMDFYESRDKAVKCDEPSPPKNIIPKRHKDGEWNKNPVVVGQRLGKLGDQIDCLKIKYFGIDPLDSPFFKEKEIEAPSTVKHTSNDDRYGLYFDVVQNIKSNFKGESSIQSDSKVNGHVFPTPKVNDQLKTVSYFQHVPSKKGSDVINNKYNSSHHNENPVFFEESRITLTPLIKRESGKVMLSNSQNKSNSLTATNEKSNISYSTSTSDSITIHGDQMKSKDDLTQLHSPKNVFISLRSKGTSNHPKIGVIKRALSPYNLNIKIVPMSTVGYLKSHPPLHISLKHTLKSNNTLRSSGELINKLDSISSEASKATRRKKFPEGRLKQERIRTFAPIKSYISDSKSELYSDKPSIKEDNIEFLPQDEISKKPKYRVKRNHENDKYINSKESLELKNLLFQKYSEILANEHTQASAKGNSEEHNTSEKALTTKKISTTTSRNIGGFFNRGKLPYSSRYSAGEEGSNTSSDVKDAKVNKFTVKNPIRNEKLRFPKLNMNTRTVNDSSKTKISSSPDPITLRMSTTTSTTTEEPPTTTTRMYKPRVIYKKEYGKPLDKVVNIFAVLNRQPPSSMEKEITTSSEYIDDVRSSTPETTSKPIKRLKPKRLQQFERRRFTKEEVVRETFTPVSEINERSDKIDAIYDHPDLRGPVSRISRDTPDEYDEMLVYIVNPRTGIGEWKMLPVATKTISRMDEDIRDYLKNQGNTYRQSKTRKQISKENVEHVKHSRLKPVEEIYGEITYIPDTGNAPKEISRTESDPKISRSKSRRKHTSRTHKNKMYLNSSELRTMQPPATEAAAIEYATPEYATPEYANPEHVNPTDILPTSRVSYTTFRPKIIMDPQKRKYFYAKI